MPCADANIRLRGGGIAATMQDVPLSIRSLFEYGARYFPASKVLTYDGKHVHTRSFSDFPATVARLAEGLARLGIGPGDRVASFCWNHDHHLECYFAVPMMGAVLHTVNIRLATQQVRYIVDHAGDSAIIVDHSLLEILRGCGPFKTVRHIIVIGAPRGGLKDREIAFEDMMADGSGVYAWPELDERTASTLCYTSGTTGEPKGVMYSHRSVVLQALAQAGANVYGLSQADRILAAASMFHANSWGLPYSAWMVGADLILPSSHLQPVHLCRLIEEEKPTFSAGVPTIFNDLLHFAGTNGKKLSSLRAVVIGGSALPRSLMERYQAEHQVTMIQGYGMTETSPLVSLSWPPREAASEAAMDYRQRTGRAIFGVEVRIVDDEGAVLPWDDRAVGELQLRGPWITGSYYAVSDETRFSDGWLGTGDIARIDAEGYIQITDRAKDIIKSGGEWISSMDLENLLAGHPAILEAAVIGVPDERWQERPLACIVPKTDPGPSPDQLADFLRDKVARWWVPERWTCLNEIPRTTVGKIDKKVIRAAYERGEYEINTLRELSPAKGRPE